MRVLYDLLCRVREPVQDPPNTLTKLGVRY